jgi:thymidylate kinase
MVERMAKRGDANALDEKYAKLKERPLDCFKQHFYELQSSKTYGNRIKIVDATKVISTVSSSTVEICKEIMFGGLASDRQYYNRVQALRVW